MSTHYTFDSTVDDGLSFSTWLRLAERYCLGLAGVGLQDLPDTCSHDAWDAGETPRDHVDDALYDEGFPFPEGHRFHVPEPPPRSTPLNPNGQWYTDTIVTESGHVYTLRRSRSGNGRHVVIGITLPPEGRHR